MRTLLSVAVLAGAVGVVSADDKKDPVAGKWVVESVTRDGKPVDALKGAVRVLGDGKYTLTPAAGSKAEPSSGTYALDTTKSPTALDTTAKGGTYDGKTVPGIVKVDGDTLTIAYGEPGKDRPAKFESAAGSGVTVAVHKRAK